MAQLDLFAPAVESFTIEATRDVILRGASSESVPVHRHTPRGCPRALDADEWLLVLRVAEEQIRWRSWPQPHPLPLDEKPRDVAGGRGDCWYDGKGVAVDWTNRRYATWAVLLAGLAEQREAEPEIADARDLAHAYSAVETYDRYYIRDGGTVAPGPGNWREEKAVPHFERLQEIIRELGGDPAAALA